jgi:hypothetical protein
MAVGIESNSRPVFDVPATRRSDGAAAIARAEGFVLVDPVTGVAVGGSEFPQIAVTQAGTNKIITLSPITMASSYAATQNIGGLLTIDLTTELGVSMANKIARITSITATLSGTTVTSSGAIVPVFWSGNPSATTFTDAAATTVNSADRGKPRSAVSMSAVNGTNNFANMTVYYAAHNALVTCDANGRIYLSLQSGGVMTLTSVVMNVSMVIGYDAT